MAKDDKTVFDPGATMQENDATVYEDSAVTQLDDGATMPEAMLSDAAGRDDAPASNLSIQKGDTILDTYKVESDAIEGGMGSVWRVHHTGWNTGLAMKRPQPKCFATEKSKADFMHECEAWINLGLHPNIVSCYYVREISDTPSIFSEWMDGGSLESAIQKGTLYDGTEAEQKERILDIAIQFARGLHYAHEAGLIHQDVKPDNLLPTKEGDAKVADFGLARAHAVLTVAESAINVQEAADSGKTIASPSGGYTPAYCSMEQMDGKELTRRTDIYSWAVSVMEMYVGSRPWANGVVAGLSCRGYFEDTKLPMPEALKELLAKCMEAVPDDRPHDFAQIETELLAIYRAETGSDYPRPAPKAAADTADSLNNRALSMLDMQKYGEVKALLARAVAKDPRHAEAAYNLALLQWRDGAISDQEALTRLSAINTDDGGERLRSLCQRLETERGGETPVTRLAANIGRLRAIHPLPGSRAILIATMPGQFSASAWLWDMERDVPLQEQPMATGVDGVYVLMDGRYVVLNSLQTPVLFDGETGARIDVPALAALGRMSDVTFCADWKRTGVFFMNRRSGPLRHFNAESRELRTVGQREPNPNDKYSKPVLRCALQDGGHILVGRSFMDIATLEFTGQLQTEDMINPNDCFAVLPDGAFLLRGCRTVEPQAFLHEPQTGELVKSLPLRVDAAAFSRDGRYALFAIQHYVQLVDTSTWRCLRSFTFDNRVPECVAFSQDGRACYALSQYTEGVYRWTIPAAFPAADWEICRITAVTVRLGAEQRFSEFSMAFLSALAAARYDEAVGHLRALRAIPGYADDPACARMAAQLVGHLRPERPRALHMDGFFDAATMNQTCAVLSPDGRRCLSPDHGKLYDADNGNQLFTAPFFFDIGGFSKDGARCLIATDSAQALLLDARTGKCLRHYAFGRFGSQNLAMHEAFGPVSRVPMENAANIVSVALSPGGGILAMDMARTGRNGFEEDVFITVWELASMRCVCTFADRFDRRRPKALVISPDGQSALVASVQSLKRYDLQTGKLIRDYGAFSVSSGCFSPDGDRIVTDNGIVLDTESGEPLSRCQVIQANASCFLGDTGFAVTAGRRENFEGRLIIWNTNSGETLLEQFSDNSIVGVSARSDGTRLMTVDRDRHANVYLIDWEYPV